MEHISPTIECEVADSSFLMIMTTTAPGEICLWASRTGSYQVYSDFLFDPYIYFDCVAFVSFGFKWYILIVKSVFEGCFCGAYVIFLVFVNVVCYNGFIFLSGQLLLFRQLHLLILGGFVLLLLSLTLLSILLRLVITFSMLFIQL